MVATTNSLTSLKTDYAAMVISVNVGAENLRDLRDKHEQLLLSYEKQAVRMESISSKLFEKELDITNLNLICQNYEKNIANITAENASLNATISSKCQQIDILNERIMAFLSSIKVHESNISLKEAEILNLTTRIEFIIKKNIEDLKDALSEQSKELETKFVGESLTLQSKLTAEFNMQLQRKQEVPFLLTKEITHLDAWTEDLLAGHKRDLLEKSKETADILEKHSYEIKELEMSRDEVRGMLSTTQKIVDTKCLEISHHLLEIKKGLVQINNLETDNTNLCQEMVKVDTRVRQQLNDKYTKEIKGIKDGQEKLKQQALFEQEEDLNDLHQEELEKIVFELKGKFKLETDNLKKEHSIANAAIKEHLRVKDEFSKFKISELESNMDISKKVHDIAINKVEEARKKQIQMLKLKFGMANKVSERNYRLFSAKSIDENARVYELKLKEKESFYLDKMKEVSEEHKSSLVTNKTVTRKIILGNTVFP